MSASKKRAWLLTFVFGALFALSAWPMAMRIQAFNRTKHFRHYHIEPIEKRVVKLGGYPTARFEDAQDPSGHFAEKLTYGDPDSGKVETRLIPLSRPAAIDLPDLGIFAEWMRVLAINEVVRDQSGDQYVDEKSVRLLVVVRRTPEGFDPESWGAVRRTEWLFDFYELKPDGSITLETRRWPMPNDRYEKSFQERAAAAAAGEGGRPPDTRLKNLADIPPLGERSVEYMAALHVIPKLNVPKYKFTDTALSIHVLGWTLPVCMLAGLGFSFAFFFAVAPKRVAGAERGSEGGQKAAG